MRGRIDEPVLLPHRHCETVKVMPPIERKESSALPRVLLVDDHEAILTRTADVLKASCATSAPPRMAARGIDAAATLRPDVIVLDMSMPGMTGLELAGSLREAGSTAVLIFFTVHQRAGVELHGGRITIESAGVNQGNDPARLICRSRRDDASDARNRAVAVILSGLADDGSAALGAVNGCGRHHFRTGRC